MRTSDFDYELPARYIAQTPLEHRDESRLLVLDKRTGTIEHARFMDIGGYLQAGDVLVINETRVIPARLYARKLPSGGRLEILLLRKRDELTWEALVGGKSLSAGRQLQVETLHPGDFTPRAVIEEVLEGAERLVRFERPIEALFPNIGHVPLPPYIHTHLEDPERYQTIYSKTLGSAAAPTAGLHFSPQLMERLRSRGIQFAEVTLHVGLDTFAPVNESNPIEHKIHAEWCQVKVEAVEKITNAKKIGRKVVAVGTTSVRTMESAVKNGELRPYEGWTSLYILPGFNFRIVDAMITNFHLPRSTLIMLVSAFAGRNLILKAYEEAKKANYRFYSFGDAMLIL